MGKEEYKDKIIEMVKDIKSEKYLKFLFTMMQKFKKEWGI